MRIPDGYMTITDAAELAGYSRVSIISWCKQHSIGKKIAGRWFVNTDQLCRFLDINNGVPDNAKEKNNRNKKASKGKTKKGS